MKIHKEGWGGLVRSTGLALSCAALAACSTLGGGGTCDTLCTAKKTVTVAHLGHEAAADAATVAASSGFLKGSSAATAKSLLDESAAYLSAADAALAAGDALGATAKAGAATTDIGQIESLAATH